jgi:hypothetical protein
MSAKERHGGGGVASSRFGREIAGRVTKTAT